VNPPHSGDDGVHDANKPVWPALAVSVRDYDDNKSVCSTWAMGCGQKKLRVSIYNLQSFQTLCRDA
jgi:hypothetical protein